MRVKCCIFVSERDGWQVPDENGTEGEPCWNRVVYFYYAKYKKAGILRSLLLNKCQTVFISTPGLNIKLLYW